MNTRRNILKAGLGLILLPASKLVAAVTKPARVPMPDIDCDFPPVDGRVAEYLKEKSEVLRLATDVQRSVDDWLQKEELHVARVRAVWGLDFRDPPNSVFLKHTPGTSLKVGYTWSNQNGGTYQEFDIPTRDWDLAIKVVELLSRWAKTKYLRLYGNHSVEALTKTRDVLTSHISV